MTKFMDEDFLLKSEPAKRLYHDYAKKMPIIDYHCHINPKDIADDIRYDSITDVWLGGDHYKWRLIRANGTPECDVTLARENEKYRLFENFAKALPKAIGNPIYHWSYLELKRYFGIDKQLTSESAKEIYDYCNEKLGHEGMSARGLIEKSNVKIICTTDDPIDTLIYHKIIAEDKTCKVKVYPAFRPDRVLNLEKPDFTEYIGELSKAAGISVTDYDSLLTALSLRIDFFHEMGCRASDHGFDYMPYMEAEHSEICGIFSKALMKSRITSTESDKYRTALLIFFGKKYQEKNWVMQIHFGCMRNLNTRMYDELGADTGFDAMNGDGRPYNVAKFLDSLDKKDELPKMILYSLNPTDSEILASILPSFMANSQTRGKVQLGAAWWFLDNKDGIEKQLADYGNSTLLGNFVGMLTDSRSFLSYTRHEYFRRILCNFIGNLVENGEYPEDYEILGKIVEDICYNNTAEFFGFNC